MMTTARAVTRRRTGTGALASAVWLGLACHPESSGVNEEPGRPRPVDAGARARARAGDAAARSTRAGASYPGEGLDGGPSPRNDAGPRAERGAAALVPPLADSPCAALDTPIAFTSTRSSLSAEPELFVVRQDGTGLRRVTGTTPVFSPAWSPDGRVLALAKGVYATESAPAATRLLLVEVGQLGEVSLTRMEGDGVVMAETAGAPSWSPDGRFLAFSAAEGDQPRRIWRISRAGGSVTQLTSEPAGPHLYPSWSPVDADRLALVSGSGELADELWVVSLSGAQPARELLGGRLRAVGRPRWSPDAARLAFHGLESSPGDPGYERREIYVLDLESGELQRITDNQAEDAHPAWSPDGRQLVFVSSRGRSQSDPRPDLWRLDWSSPEDSAVRVSLGGMVDASPDWYWGASCGGS